MPMCCSPMCGSVWAWSARWSSAAGISTGLRWMPPWMALAKPDCMIQHPLPAHRGEEITAEVLEAHANEILDEAENRIYVEKAVLAVLLAGE